jgi:hypothetical protein
MPIATMCGHLSSTSQAAANRFQLPVGSTPASFLKANVNTPEGEIAMALPPEHRTPRMELLGAIVASTRRERLRDFPVLRAAHHQLSGIFVQLFN